MTITESPDEEPWIRSEDLLPFTEMPNIPFLKRISLDNCEPSDFGLTEWEPSFTISNAWIRKIYEKEIYRDDDVPVREPEKLQPWQLKLLNDYVNKRKKAFEKKNDRGKTRDPSLDPLFKMIAQFDKINPYGDTPDGEPEEIDNLVGHEIQPCETIVQLALHKMKSYPN